MPTFNMAAQTTNGQPPPQESVYTNGIHQTFTGRKHDKLEPNKYRQKQSIRMRHYSDWDGNNHAIGTLKMNTRVTKYRPVYNSWFDTPAEYSPFIQSVHFQVDSVVVSTSSCLNSSADVVCRYFQIIPNWYRLCQWRRKVCQMGRQPFSTQLTPACSLTPVSVSPALYKIHPFDPSLSYLATNEALQPLSIRKHCQRWRKSFERRTRHLPSTELKLYCILYVIPVWGAEKKKKKQRKTLLLVMGRWLSCFQFGKTCFSLFYLTLNFMIFFVIFIIVLWIVINVEHK